MQHCNAKIDDFINDMNNLLELHTYAKLKLLRICLFIISLHDIQNGENEYKYKRKYYYMYNM